MDEGQRVFLELFVIARTSVSNRAILPILWSPAAARFVIPIRLTAILAAPMLFTF
jgi:hypothetical protein